MARASIALDITGYGTWSVTEAGRRVLKGADKVTLRKDTLKPATARPRVPPPMPSGAGRRRAGRHRAVRGACASAAPNSPRQQRVAAYVVFADKTLIDMAGASPRTATEMSAVHGVGEAKLRQYGEIFLDAIRQHARQRNP